MPQDDASYVDDRTIADEAPLWRRVPPMHIIFDENLDRFVHTSILEAAEL